MIHNATADATVEEKKYLNYVFLPRTHDPLTYWKERAVIFPHLYVLANKYLCQQQVSLVRGSFQRLEKLSVKHEVG